MKALNYPSETIQFAIWAAFPVVEQYRNFKIEKRNISIANRFIELAHQQGLIRNKNDKDFEAFLNYLSELYKDRNPSKEFTFVTLIKEIKQETSIRSLINQLKELAEIFGFEQPTEVLFTRLKKKFKPDSLKKQHALMLLSIWLGLNKAELALNYQTLQGFPRKMFSSNDDEKTGILVSFSFVGEHIDASFIDFLKRELLMCCRDLNINYLTENRIQYLATSCRGRFPIKEDVAGFPSSYGEAIRDALFLVYQMFICWELSDIYDPKIHFVIALEAGSFDAVEVSIKDLLLPDIPLGYPFRLSHFAFIIAEQAEQKIVCKPLKDLSVWVIEHFWSFPYFKGPHCLFPGGTAPEKGGEPLPITNETISDFHEALIFGETKSFKILSVINQHPHKVLSSLAIATILTYRRLHHTAIRLLSIMLATDPKNYIARTIRMSNFTFLGNYSQDLETAELFYSRGLFDGEFIDSTNPPDPVFYAEYSLVFWSKAMKLIKFLRKGAIKNKKEARQTEIINLIQKAENYAHKGTIFRMFSDTRCTIYLQYYLGFRRLIEKNPGLLTDKAQPFLDTEGIFLATAKSMLQTIGWMSYKDGQETFDEHLANRKRTMSIKNYLNSVSSPSFSINFLFILCVTLWDFSGPEQRKQFIDQILFYLDLSTEKIEQTNISCLGIYSLSPAFPVIQSPREYLNWVQKAKYALLEVKKTGDYKTGLRLSLMQFDDEVTFKPITMDLIRAEEKSISSI